MSLPSLATLEQFEAYYGAEVANPTRLQFLLDIASDLARKEAGESYVDVSDVLTTVPTITVGIVCQVTRRAYDNPAGLEGETIGDYTWRGGDATGSGVYLTSEEARAIKRAAGKVSPSAFSVSTYGPVGYLGTTEDTDWS